LPRSAIHRRLTAWLALVALGLLLVAPTLSRTQAALAAVPDLGAWCTGHGLDRTHGTPSTPEHPADEDACGYCVLLGHSPALTGSFVAFVHALEPAYPLVREARLAAPYLRALPLHSRGPPAP
jgi:hypothetical protein